MASPLAHLAVAGSVALITLNDPTRRNVLSAEMVAGIGDALDEAEGDDAVRCVVLTGAGKAFCAGAELDTLLGTAEGDFGPVARVYDGFLRVLRSPLLTVAAVNGPAVGAGMNLALACDLRIAGPSAFFDTRFAQLRLHPGGGHMWLLQRAVGYQQTAAASVLSASWDAHEAQRIGMVLAVTGPDLVDRAVAIASGAAGLDRRPGEANGGVVQGQRRAHRPRCGPGPGDRGAAVVHHIARVRGGSRGHQEAGR